MKFINTKADVVKLRVAVQFEYRGYTISSSTLMNPNVVMVAVINKDGTFASPNLRTVEDAIEWVNSR